MDTTRKLEVRKTQNGKWGIKVDGSDYINFAGGKMFFTKEQIEEKVAKFERSYPHTQVTRIG